MTFYAYKILCLIIFFSVKQIYVNSFFWIIMCECCGGDCKLTNGVAMSGECDHCGNNSLDCVCQTINVSPNKLNRLLSIEMITRLEDIGRAAEKLKRILDVGLFIYKERHMMSLQERENEIECLKDNLWDLWAVLRPMNKEI